MSSKDTGPDELEGTEQPFVSHLVELRDRLIRALVAVGVCFGVLAFWPGPAALYDLLAQPLVAHLPVGTKLIATNVISDATLGSKRPALRHSSMKTSCAASSASAGCFEKRRASDHTKPP